MTDLNRRFSAVDTLAEPVRKIRDEMGNGADPAGKKSLMSALENLERKAGALEDIANYSEYVVEKLNNPRLEANSLIKAKEDCDKKETVRLDLIDLFNLVADKIDYAATRISKNTELIKSFIE
jgi:hypothetical protein